MSAAVRRGNTEVLVHRGQHYDFEMSEAFYRELDLSQPQYNLGVGSGPQGRQTGDMMARLEEVMLAEQPDCALVYGIRIQLAGALVAAKLHMPLAHVEAGLRSFNRAMPEEINRVVADQLSQLLFCPSVAAVENLRREGINDGVHLVEDVMYDAMLRFLPRAGDGNLLLDRIGVRLGEYVLATVHRAGNTADQSRLSPILDCLSVVDHTVVFPAHPRTVQALDSDDRGLPDNVRLIEPVNYLEMLRLESHSLAILTDSGGIQNEAFWLSVPCVTLRDETESVETVEAGWNEIAGTDADKVCAALAKPLPQTPPPPVYGNGHASERIAQLLGGA